MKKYQATPGYLPSIELFEADRETERYVWIDGIRAHKSNPRESYHDTFDEAKAHLLELARFELDDRWIKLHRSQKALELVKNLKDIE